MKSDKTIEIEKKRIAYEHIDTMKCYKLNTIKISKANSDKHELMKYLICRQLCREKKDFITECIFKNGKRADIVVPGELKIIEILHSESPEECTKKMDSYPKPFEKFMIEADQRWHDKLIY